MNRKPPTVVSSRRDAGGRTECTTDAAVGHKLTVAMRHGATLPRSTHLDTALHTASHHRAARRYSSYCNAPLRVASQLYAAPDSALLRATLRYNATLCYASRIIAALRLSTLRITTHHKASQRPIRR